MKNKKLLLLISQFVACAAVVGSVLAAGFSVTDNADPYGIAITLDKGTRQIILNTGGSTLWDQAGAWFVAHCWGGEDADYTLERYKETSLFTAEISKNHSGIVFARVASGAEFDKDWTNVWDKTSDLSIPEDKDMYTITAFGSSGEPSKGQWGNHTHVPLDAVIENEIQKTCTTPGAYDEVVYCDLCGAVISSEHHVVPAGHDSLDHVEAIEATCTSSGNIEYWHCSDCEKYFNDVDLTHEIASTDIVIAAKGHNFENTWTSDLIGHWYACSNGCDEKNSYSEHTGGVATETDWGVCSVCGKEYIAPLGHTHVHNKVDAQAATCTVGGWEEYYECTCGQLFKYEGGEYVEITSIPSTEPLGHSLDSGTVTTPATCTTDGILTKHCTHNGCTYTETSTIHALGHNMDEGTQTKAPTCTEPGILTKHCTNAGCDHTETSPIPALGHSYGTDHYCTKCGELDPQYVKVTFVVNYETYDNGDLYFLGDKTGWTPSSSNMMTWTDGNNWKFTYVGKIGDKIGFKFYRTYSGGGGIWERDGEGNERKYTFSTSKTESLSWGIY